MTLGLDDLVLEAQNKFDQLEMLLNGLLSEHDTEGSFLDEETILSSIDSMILQATLLEEYRRIKSEKDKESVQSRITKYDGEFKDLHQRKQDLNRKLMDTQNLDVSAIMAHVRTEKREIVKKALLSCGKIVSSMPYVTRDELDRIFEKALLITCKSSISKFIQCFD